MFCQNCGTQLPEDAVFCPECGTKTESAAILQTGAEKGSADKGAPGDLEQFRQFVDNHVRSTTKFQSAEELLRRKDPLLQIWILFFSIFTILGCIVGGPLGIVLGIFFGHIAKWIAGGVIRYRCFSRTSGKVEGGIDGDCLRIFLDTQLNGLYPCFHAWDYWRDAAAGGFTLVSGLGEKKKNIYNGFVEEERCFVELRIPPKNQASDTGREYMVFVEDGWMSPALSGIAGYFLYVPRAVCQLLLVDQRPVCMLRLAPILQAAVLYYIKSKSKS